MKTLETTAPTVPTPAPTNGILKVDTIKALTGLRFLAITLVYMCHLPIDTNHTPGWLVTFMQGGVSGVTLFFVLSGFIICYNYYPKFEKDLTGNLWPFFVARIARIYPIYIFFFIFYFSLTTESFKRDPLTLFQQLTLTQAWNPDITVAEAYDAVAWAISVEVFLYVCFPFIAHFILRYCQQIKQLLILGGVVYLLSFGLTAFYNLNLQTKFPDVFTSHFILYQFPPDRLPDFIIGCVAARIYMLRKGQPISQTEQRIGLAALIISIIAVGVIMDGTWPWMLQFRFDAGYTLFFVCIIFCLASYRSPLASLLSTGWCMLLGEASYSFYMVHRAFIVHFYNDLMVQVPGYLHIYVFNFLIFVLVNLTALGMLNYFEIPFRRFIRRILLPKSSLQKS